MLNRRVISYDHDKDTLYTVSGNAVKQTDHKFCFVGFEVLIMVAVKSMVFSAVTQHSLEKG
jgi:hypothetical protein